MVLMVVAGGGGGRALGSMPQGFSGNGTVSRPAIYDALGDGREKKNTMLSTGPAKNNVLRRHRRTDGGGDRTNGRTHNWHTRPIGPPGTD